MKKQIIKSTLIIAALFFTAKLSADNGVKYPAGFTPQKNASINFKENLGQVSDQNYKPRPDVLFSGTDGQLTYHLKNNGISYQLSSPSPALPGGERAERLLTEGRGMHGPSPTLPGGQGKAPSPLEKAGDEAETTIYRLDINWLNANTKAVIKKGEALPGFDNYYLAVCPDGVTNVKSYTDITYQQIYNGIDLKWYQKDGHLKYDYIVTAGADYKQIQLELNGAQKIKLNTKGELVISTPLGDIIEQAPLVTQNGKNLASNWLITNNFISFNIEGINSSEPFIIDPVVRLWGTYYGGTGDDRGNSCVTDASGNVYLAGYTESSSNIATNGSQQSTFGGNGDAFLAKFDGIGARLWSTYYGGTGDDHGISCVMDASGNVYLAGYTNSSSNIATSGSHQSIFGGYFDVFLAKFDGAGIRQWCTYYGGMGNDRGYSCAIDALGNIYLAGSTSSSSNIATSGSHQSTSGGYYDAFLAKFDGAGIRQWGTFYGGANDDYGTSCVTDASGNMYLAGRTNSSLNIATIGSHQSVYGGGYYTDAFLVKFDGAGIRQWGTYYGGTNDDYGSSCVTDASGNVYLAGNTNSSSNIATGGSHQSTGNGGGWDAFLVKFNGAGIRQ